MQEQKPNVPICSQAFLILKPLYKLMQKDVTILSNLVLENWENTDYQCQQLSVIL